MKSLKLLLMFIGLVVFFYQFIHVEDMHLVATCYIGGMIAGLGIGLPTKIWRNFVK
jgi:hypothetical protein